MSDVDKQNLIFNREVVDGIYPRGSFTDVERIKQHLEYLTSHFGVLDECPIWDINNPPTQSDFQRMLNTVKRVRAAGVKLSSTPQVPSVVGYDYASANRVEQILYDLELMIDNVLESYKYSGTFYSGQEVVL